MERDVRKRWLTLVIIFLFLLYSGNSFVNASVSDKDNRCINHNWVLHSGDSITTDKYNSDGSSMFCTYCKKHPDVIYDELVISKPWKTDYAGKTKQYWENYENAGYGDGTIAELWHHTKASCTSIRASGSVPKTYNQPSYYKCSKCGCIKTTDNSYGMTSIISQGSQLYDINGKSLDKKATNIEVNINRYCWQNGLIAKYFTYDSKYNTCNEGGSGDKGDTGNQGNTGGDNSNNSSNNGSNNTSTHKNEYVNGVWYDGNGKKSASYTNGHWASNNKGYWFEDNGWYPMNQWLKINGKWYYFLSDGYMDYSEYRDGCWLTADGYWDTSYSGGHWDLNATGWWYEDNGWYPVNQYLWIDGVKYWFGADGYMG